MRLALGLLLACVLVSPGRSAVELVGRVIECVACRADSSQEYALYIPPGYSPEKKWPVIFCFDPGAHGRVPVKRLQTAAEKYGYIVAGSLNSRNGPWADNAAAIQAMVRDVGVAPGHRSAAGLHGRAFGRCAGGDADRDRRTGQRCDRRQRRFSPGRSRHSLASAVRILRHGRHGGL